MMTDGLVTFVAPLLQLPVLVSDLDLECKMWIKLRLAPMCPYIGSISLAFVGPPIIKVQLLPYNRVRIMRIPILQVSPTFGHAPKADWMSLKHDLTTLHDGESACLQDRSKAQRVLELLLIVKGAALCFANSCKPEGSYPCAL
jgi:hypothetical protein